MIMGTVPLLLKKYQKVVATRRPIWESKTLFPDKPTYELDIEHQM